MVGYRTDLRLRRWQMYERYTGQVGEHDVLHLGVGANLEEMRKLVLDFGKRPARGDLEHERGIAEQSAVADHGNEGIVGALDNLQADCAAADAGAEEILQVPHHRPEH